MKATLTRLFLTLAVCFMMTVGNLGQVRQGTYTLPSNQIVPGHPWTQVIPDPDKFDWSTKRDGGRPGYRYRGMLPVQQRFYDYIQQKRRNNVPLTSAEEARKICRQVARAGLRAFAG